MKTIFYKLNCKKIVRPFLLASIFLTTTFSSQLYAQLKVGDPGVRFDSSKLDRRYPQMREWQRAGVQGGIPFRSQAKIIRTLNPTNSAGLNAAIREVSGNGGGAIRLNNGTYTIDIELRMRNDVRLIGASKDGVRLRITKTSGDAISFRNANNSGLDNLTVEGAFGTPNNFDMVAAKPSFYATSVAFPANARNCWVDNCSIINSGRHALIVFGNNITIRDSFVSRCWNKGPGYEGYFHVGGSYNLVTNTRTIYLRHMAIQNSGARYNVIYRNNTQQEVNFHNDDAGDNLVEQNTIAISGGIQNIWHAMMGPWSRQHRVSQRDNYIYKNSCIENNNNGLRSYSDSNRVYIGPRRFEGSNPFDTTNNTPSGGTFYPIILGNNAPSSPPSAPPPPAQTGTSNISAPNSQLISDGLYSIKSAVNNQRLRANQGNGFNAEMENFGNFTDQQWEFRHLGGNNYTIKNIRHNRYLEVPFARCENRANVGTWTGAGSNHQRWRIERNGSYYAFRPLHCLGMAMDRNGGANFANIHLFGFSSSNRNQRWEIIRTNRGSKLLEATDEPNTISVYPNPADINTSITINGIIPGETIEIYNGFGQLMKQVTANSSTQEISLDGLSAGIYFISSYNNAALKLIVR